MTNQPKHQKFSPKNETFSNEHPLDERSPPGENAPAKRNGLSPVMLALIVVIILALGIIVAYTVFSAEKNNPDTNQGPNFPVFETRPLQVTIIREPSCTNCYSVDSLVDSLEVNPAYKIALLRDLNAESDVAQKLISDYNIRTLPTVIVTGEIASDLQNSWQNSLLSTPDGNRDNSVTEPNNSLVLRAVKFPYYSIPTGRVMGEVQMVVLSDANCLTCRKILSDLNRDENGFANVNQPLVINGDGTENEQTVFVSTIRFVDKNSPDGNGILSRYNIKRLPTVLLSPSATDYKYINRYSGEIGFTTGIDGWLYNDQNPPFVVLASGNVRGYVNLIMVSDANCETCFDPAIAYKQFFDAYDVTVGKTTFYGLDSNEGHNLIQKYQLRHLPALIANSDLVVYTKLALEWENAWGTRETDGNFVFRAVPRLSTMAMDANFTYTTLDENGNIADQNDS